jgi:hypothetical protein
MTSKVQKGKYNISRSNNFKIKTRINFPWAYFIYKIMWYMHMSKFRFPSSKPWNENWFTSYFLRKCAVTLHKTVSGWSKGVVEAKKSAIPGISCRRNFNNIQLCFWVSPSRKAGFHPSLNPLLLSMVKIFPWSEEGGKLQCLWEGTPDIGLQRGIWGL